MTEKSIGALKVQLDQLQREREERETIRAMQEESRNQNALDADKTGRELGAGDFIVPRRIANRYTEVDGKFHSKDSLRYHRLGRQMVRLHERIAQLRLNFVHRESTKLVRTCAVIATEELAPKNMSRSARGTIEQSRRVRPKAGLNREILSAAFGMAHRQRSCKAAEAGTRLHLANTRQLKPSQRCAACWEIVPKTLSQRVHACPHCGHAVPRDQNSAQVVLINTLEQWNTPGTGVAARSKPLPAARPRKSKSATRETHATTSQGV